MKNKFTLTILVVILGAVLMTGCGGNSALSNASSWPGLTEADGVVYTANAYTVEAVRGGERLWFYPNDPEEKARELFFANPVIDSGLVYAGSYSNRVYVLDAETGSLEGKITLPDDKHKLIAPVVVTDALVLIPSSDSTLYAYRKGEYGQPIWKTALTNELWQAPTVLDGTVYAVTLDKKIHTINLADGKLIRSVGTDGAIMDGFTASGGRLYFSTFGRKVEILDPATGEIKTLLNAESEFWAAPLVIGEALIAVDLQGTIYARSLDGAELWTRTKAFGESARVIARPVALPNDRILMISAAGDMKIYDLEGRSEDERSINAIVQTAPVSDGDTIVVALVGGDALLKAYTPDLKEDWVYVGTVDAKTEATRTAAAESSAAGSTSGAPEAIGTAEGK